MKGEYQPSVKGEPQPPMKGEEHSMKGGAHPFKERGTTYEGGDPMARGPSCDGERQPPVPEGRRTSSGK